MYPGFCPHGLSHILRSNERIVNNYVDWALAAEKADVPRGSWHAHWVAGIYKPADRRTPEDHRETTVVAVGRSRGSRLVGQSPQASIATVPECTKSSHHTLRSPTSPRRAILVRPTQPDYRPASPATGDAALRSRTCGGEAHLSAPQETFVGLSAMFGRGPPG
jgi:hypothetical protein